MAEEADALRRECAAASLRADSAQADADGAWAEIADRNAAARTLSVQLAASRTSAEAAADDAVCPRSGAFLVFRSPHPLRSSLQALTAPSYRRLPRAACVPPPRCAWRLRRRRRRRRRAHWSLCATMRRAVAWPSPRRSRLAHARSRAHPLRERKRQPQARPPPLPLPSRLRRAEMPPPRDIQRSARAQSATRRCRRHTTRRLRVQRRRRAWLTPSQRFASCVASQTLWPACRWRICWRCWRRWRRGRPPCGALCSRARWRLGPQRRRRRQSARCASPPDATRPSTAAMWCAQPAPPGSSHARSAAKKCARVRASSSERAAIFLASWSGSDQSIHPFPCLRAIRRYRRTPKDAAVVGCCCCSLAAAAAVAVPNGGRGGIHCGASHGAAAVARSALRRGRCMLR